MGICGTHHAFFGCFLFAKFSSNFADPRRTYVQYIRKYIVHIFKFIVGPADFSHSTCVFVCFNAADSQLISPQFSRCDWFPYPHDWIWCCSFCVLSNSSACAQMHDTDLAKCQGKPIIWQQQTFLSLEFMGFYPVPNEESHFQLVK